MRMESLVAPMLSMLATEEHRLGRFWPAGSSGSRSLKPSLSTGVCASHGRGLHMRAWLKNAFTKAAQGGNGEICILFLWRQVLVGGF